MDTDERRNLINTRKKPQKFPARLWVRDEWREFEVWQVPVEALLLNIDNRRFAAERKLIEKQLGHALDPENKLEDEISVISILLDTGIGVKGDRVVGKPSKDYEALKADWRARKQESPFWIRSDGTVRNGNRRLAMLKRFQEEQGAEGFDFADAIILEPEIDEQALFEMEQREQLTQDFKVQYTDINRLLAIRDAANARGIDWTDKESLERTAGLIQHVAGETKAYAIVQLLAIRAMDDFLKDSNSPGEYQKLMRRVERFRDVGKQMARMEEEYPDDLPDMMGLLFAALRAGITNYEIRDLQKIFLEDRTRYEKLVSEIEDEEKDWEKTSEHELKDPNLEEIGEGDEDIEIPAPIMANYPREAVSKLLKNAIDGYKASSSLDVVSSLEQALSRLEALTDDRDRLRVAIDSEGEHGVRAALERIIAWADEVKILLASER